MATAAANNSNIFINYKILKKLKQQSSFFVFKIKVFLQLK